MECCSLATCCIEGTVRFRVSGRPTSVASCSSIDSADGTPGWIRVQVAAKEPVDERFGTRWTA